MHTVFRTPHHDHIQKMKYLFQQVNPSENNSPIQSYLPGSSQNPLPFSPHWYPDNR